MAIGDDLMVMLGLVPVRDRAGIARGTMATEAQAAAAASPNAEGRSLIDQGMRPPSLSLPPQMRGGDVQLPDDVNAEYAAGKPKVATPAIIPQVLPPSQDRVVASSPAAAPSTAVRKQNSDIMLEAHQRMAQQAKMQQLFASIGLIANGLFNRNPDSQSSTRESLAGMMGGGGGGGGGGGELTQLEKLLKMRDEEANAERRIQDAVRVRGITRERAEALEASGQLGAFNSPTALAAEEKVRQDARDKEQRIKLLMRQQGISREDAEGLEAADAIKSRFTPENLRKDQDTRELQALKDKLRPMIPEIAKRSGENEATLYAELDRDPGKVLEMQRRQSVATARSTEATAASTEADAAKKQANYIAWADARANKDKFLKDNPTISGAAYDTMITSPSSFEKGMETIVADTGKLGKIGEVQLKEIQDSRVKAVAAAGTNAGQNRTMQDMWDGKLKSGGKYSEHIQSFAKTWADVTGQPLSKSRLTTEQFMLQQGNTALDGLKELGTQPTNTDLAFKRELAGGYTTTPKGIQQVLYLTEKANNLRIERHNEEVRRKAEVNPHFKGQGFEVEHPPPNRFMRAQVDEQHPNFIKRVVANGTHNDPATKEYFEKNPQNGIGPGVYDHLVKEELARVKGP